MRRSPSVADLIALLAVDFLAEGVECGDEVWM